MPAVHMSAVDLLTEARFGPITVAFVLLTAGWYLWSARATRRSGRSWHPARTAAFVAGEVCYVIALLSGLHAFTPSNFSAYGAQYILAVLVAPGLWAFGAPLELLTQVSEGRRRDRVFAAIDSVPFRILTHPIVTWLLFVGATLGLFFSGLLKASGENTLVADGAFAVSAILGFVFYWPLVDVDPLPRRIGTWHRILYLLLVFPVWSIVGMGIESSTNQLRPELTLASLHLGAAVIWVAGETVAIGGIIWVWWQWLRRDLEAQKRHDADHERAAAQQLALWRASRDAAARAS